MEKIILCTDDSSYSQASYEYAAWLVKRKEVDLEILYVSDERGKQVAQTNDFSENIGIDSYQQLLDELVEIEIAKAKVN